MKVKTNSKNFWTKHERLTNYRIILWCKHFVCVWHRPNASQNQICNSLEFHIKRNEDPPEFPFHFRFRHFSIFHPNAQIYFLTRQLLINPVCKSTAKQKINLIIQAKILPFQSLDYISNHCVWLNAQTSPENQWKVSLIHGKNDTAQNKSTASDKHLWWIAIDQLLPDIHESSLPPIHPSLDPFSINKRDGTR